MPDTGQIITPKSSDSTPQSGVDIRPSSKGIGISVPKYNFGSPIGGNAYISPAARALALSKMILQRTKNGTVH